jgi:hypothetical protein
MNDAVTVSAEKETPQEVNQPDASGQAFSQSADSAAQSQQKAETPKEIYSTVHNPRPGSEHGAHGWDPVPGEDGALYVFGQIAEGAVYGGTIGRATGRGNDIVAGAMGLEARGTYEHETGLQVLGHTLRDGSASFTPVGWAVDGVDLVGGFAMAAHGKRTGNDALYKEGWQTAAIAAAALALPFIGDGIKAAFGGGVKTAVQNGDAAKAAADTLPLPGGAIPADDIADQAFTPEQLKNMQNTLESLDISSLPIEAQEFIRVIEANPNLSYLLEKLDLDDLKSMRDADNLTPAAESAIQEMYQKLKRGDTGIEDISFTPTVNDDIPPVSNNLSNVYREQMKKKLYATTDESLKAGGAEAAEYYVAVVMGYESFIKAEIDQAVQNLDSTVLNNSDPSRLNLVPELIFQVESKKETSQAILNMAIEKLKRTGYSDQARPLLELSTARHQTFNSKTDAFLDARPEDIQGQAPLSLPEIDALSMRIHSMTTNQLVNGDDQFVDNFLKEVLEYNSYAGHAMAAKVKDLDRLYQRGQSSNNYDVQKVTAQIIQMKKDIIQVLTNSITKLDAAGYRSTADILRQEREDFLNHSI